MKKIEVYISQVVQQRAFPLTVTKQKPKWLKQPIRRKEKITKSQSECKVKSSTMLTDIAFGFESNWLRGWYKFSGTSTQQRKERKTR